MPSEEPRASKRRHRANTNELLPSSYDEKAVLAGPNAKFDTAEYTDEDLQQRLAYVQSLLTHDISPRCEIFMRWYKIKIKDAMTAETQDQRKKCAMMIRSQEILMQGEDFLDPFQISDSEFEFQNELFKLRKTQYLARYVDSNKIDPPRIQRYPSNTMFGDSQSVPESDFWTDFACELSTEDWRYKIGIREGYSVDTHRRTVTSGVVYSCAELGISDELAIQSILKYELKNWQIYNDLDDLRKDGKHGTLAKILYFDKAELNMVFSEFKFEKEIAAFEKIIQGEIDTWFHCIDPDDPETWMPTEAFLKVARNERERRKEQDEREVKLEKAKRPSKERSASKDEPSQSDIEKETVAGMQEPQGLEIDDQAKQDAVAKRRMDQMLKKTTWQHPLDVTYTLLPLLDDEDESGLSD